MRRALMAWLLAAPAVALPGVCARAAEPARNADSAPKGVQAAGASVRISSAPRVEDLSRQMSRLGLGSMGFRLQLSRDRDFSKILFNKVYETDAPILSSTMRLPPGDYWARVAPIDLLGTQEPFRPPGLYAVGRAPPAPAKKGASGVAFVQPSLDGEMVSAATYRVVGKAPPGVDVLVNGRGVAKEANGRFSSSVVLSEGDNTVVITVLGPDGPTETLKRKIIYRP